MGDGSSTFKFRKSELGELEQQAQVVRLLDEFGYKFCAVPNGHVRTARQQIQAKQEGMKAGIPDLLIFTPPPALYGKVYATGVALEMKRATAKSGDLRTNQRKWLRDLSTLGWVPVCGYGAADAIAMLQSLGYFPGFEQNTRTLTDQTKTRVRKFHALVEACAETREYIKHLPEEHV